MAVFASVLAAAGFIGGSIVEGFERGFAAFCGTKYCRRQRHGRIAIRPHRRRRQ
jgi:hypothetical protein